jgi:hypothetical protein
MLKFVIYRLPFGRIQSQTHCSLVLTGKGNTCSNIGVLFVMTNNGFGLGTVRHIVVDSGRDFESHPDLQAKPLIEPTGIFVRSANFRSVTIRLIAYSFVG